MEVKLRTGISIHVDGANWSTAEVSKAHMLSHHGFKRRHKPLPWLVLCISCCANQVELSHCSAIGAPTLRTATLNCSETLNLLTE